MGAILALELVNYEKKLENAMRYIFGSSFICQDAITAKRIAFEKKFNTRAVTLDGDDFKPGGLLTGGKRNTESSLLQNLYKLQLLQIGVNSNLSDLKQTELHLQYFSDLIQQYKKKFGKLNLIKCQYKLHKNE